MSQKENFAATLLDLVVPVVNCGVAEEARHGEADITRL